MARMAVVDINLKRMFLDRDLVTRLIGKDSAKALGKAAARVRLRAMHSMKKKGAARRPPKNQGGKAYRKWQEEVMARTPSPAGKPPHVWNEDHYSNTLRAIWYALDVSRYDQGDVSVVVGPLGLNQRIQSNRRTIPELHEFGGTAVVREWKFTHGGKTQWLPGKGPRRSPVTRRQRQAKYPARPFMFPALKAEAPKFPTLWTGRAA